MSSWRKRRCTFSEPDLHFAPHFYRRNLEAYRQEFFQRTTQRVAGEASVWYLLSTQAATELKAFNPDARIVIMLREPVECALLALLSVSL